MPMIFEGVTTGQCMVVFGICSNSSTPVVTSPPLYLNLRKVTDLYEHWTVGDNITTECDQIPRTAARTSDSAVFGTAQSNSEMDYILLVHGWRMLPWERRAFASTAYKRLWHLGYKGRFGLYSWPTDWCNVDDTLGMLTSNTNRANYDRSEQRAWYSAQGLWSTLVTLNDQQPESVRLIAHSMGNVVVSEALHLRGSARNTPLVHTYIATQAASVAHAYDAVNPEIVRPGWMPGVNTPEVYAAYPRPSGASPYYAGMGNAVQVNPITLQRRIINFFNGSDYALDNTKSWPMNQFSKPDIGYNYDFGWWRTKYWFNDTKLNITTNYREIFAHMAQARSKALGCSEDSTHIVRGEIGGSVNLAVAPFGFTSSTNDHSAQFNSINMNRRPYWRQVLSSFSITNNIVAP